MQDFILTIIAVSLVILTIELSIVLCYIIIFLREAVQIARRIKVLEGKMEAKVEKLEDKLALLGAKAIKSLLQRVNKFFIK